MTDSFHPTTSGIFEEAFPDHTNPDSDAARNRLIAKYWPKCLSFFEKLDRQEADDLTATFFKARFVGENWTLPRGRASVKGSFRALLRSAMRFHWKDFLKSRTTKKRGGDFEHVDFDSVASEIADRMDEFDRIWAEGLLEDIWSVVAEVENDSKSVQACRSIIEEEATYEEASASSGIVKSTLQYRVLRIRKRLRILGEIVIRDSQLEPTDEEFQKDWRFLKEAWEKKSKK